MSDLIDIKKSQRAFFKEKRRSITNEKKAELDSGLCRSVLSLVEYGQADILLAFYPSFREPVIIPIIKKAFEDGKKVACPLCDTESFIYVSSLDELVVGSYSIPEPPSNNEEYAGESNALCLVPALAFDREGYRLGYGGGYYDRFLCSFCGVSAGVTYSDLICDRLPHGEFDIKTDIIISERGTIFINGGKNKVNDK